MDTSSLSGETPLSRPSLAAHFFMLSAIVSTACAQAPAPPVGTFTQLVPVGSTLSSTSGSNSAGVAANCIDGTCAGNDAFSGSCSGRSVLCETEQEASPWLELDLGANYSVALIQIWNRQVWRGRLGTYQIWVGESPRCWEVAAIWCVQCVEATIRCPQGSCYQSPFAHHCEARGRFVSI
eukprot:6430734-Prymnesium_polylepis.2